MMLAAYYNTGFLNESKSHSQSSAFIFLSENEPTRKINGPILTIAHIIKSFMAAAAEAELTIL